MMELDQTFLPPDASCSEEEREATGDREVQRRTLHAERLKQIIAEHGWPTIPRVGARASTAAWLLVQHADHDPAFQRACLSLMTDQPSGHVGAMEIAYLTDRVLVAEGEPQVYGTQLTETDDGSYVFHTIRNPETVDERRAAAGLSTLAEYKAGHDEMVRET